MAYDVVMPQLGMTMEEGSVLRWLKQPGEPITKGEPLFEIQTDKVDMEVEAQASGFVAEILLEPGRAVPVGTVVARISQAKPEPTSSVQAEARPPVQPVQVAAANDGMAAAAPGPRLASPRARRVAADLGIDISLVNGSGQGGRITESDVLKFAETRKKEKPKAVAVAPAEPVSAARRTIAARMSESFERIPHFYLSAQADASSLKKLREDLLPVIERETGVRLTYTDLLIKALALALEEHPQVNATWTTDGIVRAIGINIGFAAQAGEALLVPVIANANRLNVAEIARRRFDLATKARAGKLTLTDLEGGSCTLSNLGSFGVDQFQAIINPPQSAILAVGQIAPRPFVDGNELVVRTTVWLTLSVDHRVIDGVIGAQFLQAIVAAIQAPYRLLLGTA